jgi:hypothetical protein
MILTANPASLARAGEAADMNPALLHYRAILSTPEISGELSDADRQLIGGSVPEPPAAADSTAKLVQAYNPTFQLLRQAASSKVRCDWGTGILVDPQTLMSVYTRAKALCHAASFRARYFLEAGRPDDAVADLIAVWALARNLTAHGTLFSVRVRDSMEALLDQFVAEHFHRFSPATLRALAAALDALPGRGSVADAIEPEKQRFVASILRPLVQLRAELSGDDHAVIAQFRESRLREAEASGDGELLVRITAGTDKLIAKAGGTGEGLQRELEEVVALHTAVEALLQMPPLAYLERSTQLLVELEFEGNPMASTLVRGAIAARNGDLVIEVQWRMLHAAIQHRLGDPLALGEFQDPAGAGPFTMRRVVLDGVDRGFALESALQVRGFKETLVFVERPGSPIIVSGPRAGELLPPPADFETLMRERYGLIPSGEP